MPYKEQNKRHFDRNKLITMSLGHITVHKKMKKKQVSSQNVAAEPMIFR